MNEVELVVCNGHKFTVEPPLFTDYNFLQVSGSVQVDTMDMEKSDHFLVWMELGRTVKTTKQQKWVIKKWYIEQFQDEEVRQKYEEALSVEVDGFQERVCQWKTQGLRGYITHENLKGIKIAHFQSFTAILFKSFTTVLKNCFKSTRCLVSKFPPVRLAYGVRSV